MNSPDVVVFVSPLDCDNGSDPSHKNSYEKPLVTCSFQRYSTLDVDCWSNLRVQFHPLHPSAHLCRYSPHRYPPAPRYPSVLRLTFPAAELCDL